jgi:hypothetical protein
VEVPSRTRGAAGRGEGFDHVHLKPYGSRSMFSERSGYHSDSIDTTIKREHTHQLQHHQQHQRPAATLEHPSKPPQFHTNQNREWVKHSASLDEDTGGLADDYSVQMASAERALDQEVVRSNSIQRNGQLVPPEDRGLNSSQSPPDKPPHYILADRSPARITSNAVTFIRNRVDAGEVRVVDRSDATPQLRPPPVPRPMSLNLPDDNAQSSRHQEVTAVVKSPDSVSSSQQSRDDSRLQRLYAKVTAKSGGSGNSVNSKQ